MQRDSQQKARRKKLHKKSFKMAKHNERKQGNNSVTVTANITSMK